MYTTPGLLTKNTAFLTLLILCLAACTNQAATKPTAALPTTTSENIYPIPASPTISVPYPHPETPHGPTTARTEIPVPNIVAVITATIQNLPHPIPRNFTSASFIDPQYGWVAAEKSLFVTQDGGENWTWLVDYPGDARHLDFISEQDGWLFTSNGLFRSTDSGLSWLRVDLPTNIITETASIKDVDFSSTQRGWIALKDQFVRTSDGGETWQTDALPCKEVLYGYPQSWDARSISLLGEQEAWLICGGNPASAMRLAYKWLYHTTDDGKTWQLILDASLEGFRNQGSVLASGYWPDLFSLDNQHAWIGTFSALFRTQDGGLTWETLQVPSSYSTLSDPQFFSPDEGLIQWSTGGEDLLLRTQDGGGTWQPIYPPVLPRRIQMLDDHHGVGVGVGPFTNYLYQSQNGGGSWDFVSQIGKSDRDYTQWPPDDENCTIYILAIDFIDVKHGWAAAEGCGEPNILFKTQDGGLTWLRVGHNIPGLSDITLSFFDPLNGFLSTGPRGILYTTKDGGETFDQRYDLTAVGDENQQFTSLSDGAKLNKGKLFLTFDGGKTWQGALRNHLVADYDLLPGGTLWVLAAQCLNTTHSMGCSFYLLNSEDYGQNWKRFNLNGLATENFPFQTRITFANPQHGWLRTLDHLYTTQDGSFTWEMVR